jgi:putative component of toxin-antitoxin plasmid stabilization module
MEKGVIEINLNDGRMWRVYFANSTQKNKILRSTSKIKDKIKSIDFITHGVCETKNWLNIADTL